MQSFRVFACPTVFALNRVSSDRFERSLVVLPYSIDSEQTFDGGSLKVFIARPPRGELFHN